MIKAEIVADSVSPQSKRLTTFKLRYWKAIHGEFMTHRKLSRNASSSRAVPFSKLVAEVRDDAQRAGPLYWGAEQKGMQSGGEIDAQSQASADVYWGIAAHDAAHHASVLARLGVHKSLCNRLLEPFSHINVVATATEWDNFFGLRLHRDAQPEMRMLAEAMWAALRASTPTLLQPGQWHLPFVDEETKKEIHAYFVKAHRFDHILSFDQLESGLVCARKVSVARCARVSYESNDTGKRSTVEEDLRLYNRLVGAQPLHASPAEHQATPDEVGRHYVQHPDNGGVYVPRGWAHPKEHGNFTGWRQYRKMLPGEAVAPLPEGFAEGPLLKEE